MFSWVPRNRVINASGMGSSSMRTPATKSAPGCTETTDGGQTWQGVIAHLAQGYPKVKFAGREVGWSCLGGTWAYTVDGGKHWTSREVRFPAPVVSFSLPTPDRGYVVGDHGMIYRYRVVPFDYTSKGMLDSPMMPGADQGSPN